MIDFGLDPQAAGDAARWRHDGSSGPGHTMSDGGYVHLEPGVSADVINELTARGHRVALGNSGFGGYQAVMRDPASGVLTGATEMRKDGNAAGY